MNDRLLPQDQVFLDPNLTEQEKVVYFRDNNTTPSPSLVLEKKRDPNFQRVSTWLLLNTDMMNEIEDLKNDMKTGAGQNKKSHCLCCKTKTISKDIKPFTAKNGRQMIRSTCTQCGKGKCSSSKIKGGAIKTTEEDLEEQVYPSRDRRMNQIENEYRPLERRLRQIEHRYERVNGLLEMIIDTLNRNADNPHTNNLMMQRHDDFSDELDALVLERERILERMQELRNEHNELL